MILRWIQKQWSVFTGWHILLLPLSWVFALIVSVRRKLYQKAWLESVRMPVPVIIVGNINVGGTGKTPLVIWLAEALRQSGYQPGIISRGYGGKAIIATEVTMGSNPSLVGDEPVLMALRTQCPVFVAANRVKAAQALLNVYPECNVIISDDGLQHYRLQRDIELVVVDEMKGFGNRALLPAGPLRESLSRLKTVECVVVNCQNSTQISLPNDLPNINKVGMRLNATYFYQLINPTVTTDAAMFAGKKVKAIAGIGNPQRFFQQLAAMGIKSENVAFSDHHAFVAGDLDVSEADYVIMTEKDAVKCRAFAKPNDWVLPVQAELPPDFLTLILNKLTKLGI